METFEAVISNHGGKSVPTICATNKQRKPIYSIWTSPGLTVLKCGFLPFHEVYGFNSDHQLIWANIYNEDLYGHGPQRIYRAPVSNEKETIYKTRLFPYTHPLLKRSIKFKWKLTNLWVSCSTVLSRGRHRYRYKSIKIEFITGIVSSELKLKS